MRIVCDFVAIPIPFCGKFLAAGCIAAGIWLIVSLGVHAGVAVSLRLVGAGGSFRERKMFQGKNSNQPTEDHKPVRTAWSKRHRRIGRAELGLD